MGWSAGEWLIFTLISFVALFIIASGFYGGGGLFESLKSKTSGLVNYTLNVSVGAEEVTAEKPVLPPNQEKAVNQLKETIRGMLKSQNGEKEEWKYCFANYGQLPRLGEEGTIIEMNYVSNLKDYDVNFAGKGGTVFTIYGGARGKQLVESFIIEEMVPCVIAGSIQVTAFDAFFLNTNSWPEKLEEINQDSVGRISHHLTVNQIKIAQNNGGPFGFTENRIDYGNGYQDFEDSGYLYSPGFDRICFFPTVDGNNICDGSSEKGLDDDCLTDATEDISFARQLEEGKLIRCS